MYESILVGFSVGLILGVTGAGGSILAVPLYMLMLTKNINEAIGLALGTVAVAASIGALLHARNSQVNWRVALTVASFGAIAAPAGRLASQYLGDKVLACLFAAMAIYLSIRMWSWADSGSVSDNSFLPECETSDQASAKSRVADFQVVCWSMTVGFVSGLIGIGGGFLVVPLLIYWGVDLRKSIGTSLAVIAIISLSGFTFHIVQVSSLEFDTLVYVCLGGGLGALLGTSIAKLFSVRKVSKLFSSVVFGFTVLTLSKVFW